MSACSAACSEPSSFGIASRPSSTGGGGTNQTASVSNVAGGRSSATRLQHGAVPRRLPLVRDDVLGDGDAAERQLDAARDRERAAASSMAVVVSFFACVYQSPENGSTSAAPAARSSSLDEVRLAEVEIDGAVVDGRIRALALDDAEHRA